MSFFKVIGPLNPPKNGGLIRLENYKPDGSARMGVILRANAIPDDPKAPRPVMDEGVLFMDHVDWDVERTAKNRSPFGDMIYELEIAWVNEEREFWVLRHPRPSAIGTIKADHGDEGLMITFSKLGSVMTVTVA